MPPSGSRPLPVKELFVIAHRRQLRSANPPASISGRFTTVLHLALALGGWTALVWLGTRVVDRTAPAHGALGVLVMGLLVIMSTSLTVFWIRHNLRLSRRYGDRRSAVRDVEADWSHDKLGRPVAGPSEATLQDAAEVEIDVDRRSGRKIYRAF